MPSCHVLLLFYAQVLAKFLQLFALFPFEHHCITVSGPVALATLLAQAAAATSSSNSPSSAPSTPPLTSTASPSSTDTTMINGTTTTPPPSTATPSPTTSSSTSAAGSSALETKVSGPLRIEGVEIKNEPKKSSSLHGPGSASAEQILQETAAALRKIESGKADKPLLSESFLREVAEKYKSSKPVVTATPAFAPPR
jgi:hypothetical protein